jgi:hypothetical protein
MRKIYVYAGYHELFVSSKPMAAPFMYQAEFDTVSEAEEWLDENFDTVNDTVYYERSIYDESRLADYPYEDFEAEYYKFDIDEEGTMCYASVDTVQFYDFKLC